MGRPLAGMVPSHRPGGGTALLGTTESGHCVRTEDPLDDPDIVPEARPQQAATLTLPARQYHV